MTKVEELKEQCLVKPDDNSTSRFEPYYRLTKDQMLAFVQAVREEERDESKDKFITDIKKEVLDFNLKAESYENLKHQDRDRECELIYKAKSETFYYVTKQINRLIRWYRI